ncbi:hypothetical protein MP228_012442 [Amoeboaphelidium protococcarum]|nr:hypothetical protein MP228_012442 [Amoeboaphelidium protococcarum]
MVTAVKQQLSEQKSQQPKEVFANDLWTRYSSASINVLGVQVKLSFGVLMLSSIVSAVVIAYLNAPNGSDLRQWLLDLTNGAPARGQLGFGRFVIYGTTFPFEYPFRLLKRNFLSIITPWTCYLLHQTGQFYILTQARRAHKRGDLEWTSLFESGWNPYALSMLKLNVAFALLHYVQGYFFYDGLAASFPEISTLFAGVTSLIMPMIFEIRRRGLVFTWIPANGKSKIVSFADLTGKYHGYLASFGITLTFWYHCFESTFAHMTGFIHIFLLFWQSSMLYHREHKNKYWTAFALEMWIILHATVVAFFQGIMDGLLYRMFFFSFVFLFMMSTFWGLPIVVRYLNGWSVEEYQQHALKNNAGIIATYEGVDQKLRQQRFWTLLSVMLVIYAACVYSAYSSAGQLLYWPMIFGLPSLYYFFIAWYYGFYYLGKRIDASEWGQQNRGSKQWLNVMFGVGALSLLSIMFLAELIYRQFVPYSR